MSTTSIIVVSVLLLIILFGLFVWNIVRVKGQIRTFFYEYRKSKNRSPSKDERYHLKRVLRMMRTKDGRRLKNTKISPEHYFKEVFDDLNKDPDIDELVYHMIVTGHPDYSPHDLSLEEIKEARQSGEKTDRQKLKDLISEVHQEVLGSKGGSTGSSRAVLVAAIIIAVVVIAFAILFS